MIENLTINRLGTKGDGLSMTSRGIVAIPRTAPGDELTARIESRKGHLTATSVTLKTPSPHRQKAPCPHFDRCGGCALQHLNPAIYGDFKTSLVRDPLIAHGLGDRAEATLNPLMTIPAHTRRRVNFKVKKTKNILSLGYHRPKSRDIEPIDSCLILTPSLGALIDPFKRFLADFMAPGQWADLFLLETTSGKIDAVLSFDTGGSLTLECREKLGAFGASNPFARFQVRRGEQVDFILESSPPTVTFGHVTVPVSAGCFLQSSHSADGILANLVLAALKDVKAGGAVMDLFCGRGTFTFPLLGAGFTVTAIDSDQDALAALKQGAIRAGVRGLTVRSQNLFQDPLEKTDFTGISAVVLDPPRAGALAQVQALTAPPSVPLICMVSCNPQTFARDAKVLISAGYILDALTPIDAFLYTPHIEIVARFRHGTLTN